MFTMDVKQHNNNNEYQYDIIKNLLLSAIIKWVDCISHRILTNGGWVCVCVWGGGCGGALRRYV